MRNSVGIAMKILFAFCITHVRHVEKTRERQSAYSYFDHSMYMTSFLFFNPKLSYVLS